MNWLAHLCLVPTPPLRRLGNLAGDFVRGTSLATLHPELQRAIAQHRAVDGFVDAHPVVVAARRRLAPPFRRFAGVLLDVYFDHFLARDFPALCGGDLGAFLDGVQHDLREHHAWLPPSLQRVAPQFARDGWLAGYATVEGMAQVLGLMGRRLRRENPLASGAELLRADYAAFAADFAALWPELVSFVARADAAPNALPTAARPD
jgi:acyl carrier protein phosphodiesterase